MPNAAGAPAKPIPGVDTRYVPSFAGTAQPGQQIDHGYFWPAGVAPVDLGATAAFHWDSWCAPNGDGYLVAEGYGPHHALLWGWGGGVVNGNVWNNVALTTFGGGYVIRAGEWVHLAVDWDGTNIRVYVNGVMDGIVAFAGPRYVDTLGAGGSGKLYVMGSDHSNAGGRVANLRGWEQVDVFASANQSRLLAFIPERRPGFEATDQAAGVFPCHFYADYTRPGNVFPDLSPIGYRGRWHPGRLQGVGPGIAGAGALTNRFSPSLAADQSYANPAYGQDGNCPLWVPVGQGASNEAARSSAAVPNAARVFDSFGRANQTYAFQKTPTLGSTEGGSVGQLAWQVATPSGRLRPSLWGILGGYAVILDEGPAIAWVDTLVANQDVQVTRRKGAFDNGRTGLCFRVQDSSNYWICHYEEGGNLLVLSTVTANAQPVIVQSYNPASTTWTKLRVTTNGTTITVFVDNGAGGWTQVGQITNSTFQAATGAGIGTGVTFSATSSLLRVTNFTVF